MIKMSNFKSQISNSENTRSNILARLDIPLFKKTRVHILETLRCYREYIVMGRKGYLSWRIVFEIAVKNLIISPSRTLITVGAIALGTAAVVFLVSFSYGLQKIVTNRLVQPKSLRLADVQSQSTALSLSSQKIKEIRQIPGIESVAPAVSLAASVMLGDSRMDVVVIASSNQFLEFAHIVPIEGTIFSSQAENVSNEKTSPLEELVKLLEDGEVAGLDDGKDTISVKDEITGKTIRYRIDEEDYIPVHDSPSVAAPVIGYVRGSIVDSFSGTEVWGSTYKSVSTAGKNQQDKTGVWYGRWVKTTVPLWEEHNDNIYLEKKGELGSQKIESGFIGESSITILSDQEVMVEKQIEQLLIAREKSQVLGEATGSAGVLPNESELTVNLTGSGTSTDEAILQAMLGQEQQKAKEASSSVHLGIIEVKKKGGKEILVSTGFLNALKLTSKQALGKKIEVSYIVSGDLLPRIAGRVVSKPVSYTIIGVIADDSKPLIYAPLADIESMGVQKYSIAKIVSKTEAEFPKVREKIQTLGFTTTSIVDTLAQVDRLFKIMRFLLGTFGMIALIVALFGMFNTLTVSLLERTREIGVMKTLGTTDYDVVRLFMAESVVIGIFGGILGVSVGVEFGKLINGFFLYFQQDKTISLFYAPPSFIIFILLLSVLIGFFTGIYPSKRAKSISPLNALRYE